MCYIIPQKRKNNTSRLISLVQSNQNTRIAQNGIPQGTTAVPINFVINLEAVLAAIGLTAPAEN